MDDARNRALGRLIAALRRDRGWSQEWLASQAGMTQSVLSRVEAGKREARAGELAELARALRVGPEALLEGAELASRTTAPEARGERSRHALELRDVVTARGIAEPRPDISAEMAAGFGHDADELLIQRSAQRREGHETAPSPGLPGPDAVRLRREARAPFDERSAPVPGRALLRHAGGFKLCEASFHDDEVDALRLHDAAGERRHAFASGPPPEAQPAAQAGSPAPLPGPVALVIADYLRLRCVVAADERPWGASWETVDSLGRRRPAGRPSGWPAGRPVAAVGWNEPRDRYARLWRHELGIGVDGPVPDLVPLLEGAGLAEVIVARLYTQEPVCANVTALAEEAPGAAAPEPRGRRRSAAERSRAPGADAVSFIFVNAQRPVTLQRYALVHAFAHLVLGHGDVVDRRIEWSRATPPEVEANDFAEEFLAPVEAVARWYDRHGDPAPGVDVLLELAGAFGITFWAALYRSRAAGRLGPKPFARLQHELRARQWELLPEQSFRGGLRDTLSTLSGEVPLPPPDAVGVGGVPAPRPRDRATQHHAADTDGVAGAARAARAAGAAGAAGAAAPAVLRVPARLRVWTLEALRSGRLSLEEAAAVLRRPPADLAAELERLGLE